MHYSHRHIWAAGDQKTQLVNKIWNPIYSLDFLIDNNNILSTVSSVFRLKTDLQDVSSWTLNVTQLNPTQRRPC